MADLRENAKLREEPLLGGVEFVAPLRAIKNLEMKPGTVEVVYHEACFLVYYNDAQPPGLDHPALSAENLTRVRNLALN